MRRAKGPAMPVVEIKHIVSFSSQEGGHKAENLLNDDSSRKWKCLAGEKQASVVFQLAKSTQVSGIDIANEGSAFIEVLVGRSSNATVQYQVLLVASSFMSPQESRQGTSPNRVRMFGRDKLSSTIAEQEWDLVKVVCTQPFNKRCSYGLSFIKFHTILDCIEEAATSTSTAKIKVPENDGARKTFGNFKIKTETDDKILGHADVQMFLYAEAKKRNLNIGMWEMKNCKNMEEATKLIENREEQNESKRRSHPTDKAQVDEKRRKTEPSSMKSESTPVKFSNLKPQGKNLNTPKSLTNQKKTTNFVSTRKPHDATQQKNDDPSRTSRPYVKQTQNRPYNKILDGVVFVLSGFQNPLRSELRDKALGMGARYSRDWTPDSTHLICAFSNTPKYRQVVGCGGKIVRKEWINDCASRKQFLHWRTYNMGPNPDDNASSSEEEVGAAQATVRSAAGKEKTPSPRKDVGDESEEDEDVYGGSTDEDAGDTEDEIERVLLLQKNGGDESADDKSKEADDEDIYNASTDEESVNDDELPVLPNYLHDKHFFLYGEFSADKRKLIKRHIVACGGTLLQYMDEDVEYVITEQQWDNEFDQALTDNASLIFVRPSWLFQCGSEQRLVPYQPYAVQPA